MEDTTRGSKVHSRRQAELASRSRRARRRHTCLDNLTQVVSRFLMAGELPVLLEDGRGLRLTLESPSYVWQPKWWTNTTPNHSSNGDWSESKIHRRLPGRPLLTFVCSQSAHAKGVETRWRGRTRNGTRVSSGGSENSLTTRIELSQRARVCMY